MVSDKTDEAITLLQEHLSWDLLVEFDQELEMSHPVACLALYKEMITKYVDQHFGIHAQDFVRKATARLSNMDRKDWNNKILDYLKKKYSDRRSLWV